MQSNMGLDCDRAPELSSFYKVTMQLKSHVEELVKMKCSGSTDGHAELVKKCVVMFAALKSANRDAHEAADKASCEAEAERQRTDVISHQVRLRDSAPSPCRCASHTLCLELPAL